MPRLEIDDDPLPAPELRDYLDVGGNSVRWFVDTFEEVGMHEEAQTLRDIVEALAVVIESGVSTYIDK